MHKQKLPYSFPRTKHEMLAQQLLCSMNMIIICYLTARSLLAVKCEYHNELLDENGS